MIELLPAAALLCIVAWFVLRGAFERIECALHEVEQERFWGDGMTADGSWAEALHGLGVVEGGVIASDEDLRQIHPRDSLGRHRDPARVRAQQARPGKRKGIRLHAREGLHEPETARVPGPRGSRQTGGERRQAVPQLPDGG